MTTTHPKLTPEQFDAFGRELDAIRRRVVADLGERDATYIRKIIATQRALEVAGRGLLFVGFIPPAWLGGVAALSLSKILDNMEIGHNVMHGQYDWMRDPTLNSKKFEWDINISSDNWLYSHNYMHHTYTNIVGKDRDVGFGFLRLSEDQPWHPYYLGNPLYAAVLMVLFEWGIMLHEVEVDRLFKREQSWAETKDVRSNLWKKLRRQTLKEYVVFPLLSGPLAPLTLAGNLTARLATNVWEFSIIFCGHFPDGAQTFSLEETEIETHSGWYYRQLLGSANIDGGKWLHILTGNLSFQIEHHLFPDLPAHRYAEISVEVREICERYGLPYNTGPLYRQLGTVWRKLFTLALPDRRTAPAAAQPQAPAEQRALTTAA